MELKNLGQSVISDESEEESVADEAELWRRAEYARRMVEENERRVSQRNR